MSLPSSLPAEAFDQEALTQVPPDGLRDVMRFFESHPQSLRIRKMIFCLCKRHWENDPNKLNAISLEELLKDLIQLNPDINRLKCSLYELAGSLNRSVFYTTIADIIFEKVKIFYDSSKVNHLAQNGGQTFNILLDRAVTNLAKHPENRRIKKLIFAICKGSWESNVRVIEQYSFMDLVLELYQLKPKLKDLEASLSAMANNLNKPEVYGSISRNVLECVSLLYGYKEYKTEIDPSQEGDQTETSIVVTRLLPAKETVYYTGDSQEEKAQVPTIEKFRETSRKKWDGGDTYDKSKPVEPPILKNEKKEVDLFELRLEILKYVNPLRAKILLFSLFDSTWVGQEQDGSIFKQFTLDDILKHLLSVGVDGKIFERKLYQTAKCLPDSDNQQQVAATLLKIIQPLL